MGSQRWELHAQTNSADMMVTINMAGSVILVLVLVQLVQSEINEDLYKKGKREGRQDLGATPHRYWQDKTGVGAAKGRKNLYIYLNAYNPDRDGFCEIARQTANLVRTNQYPRRKGRSTYSGVPEAYMGGSYPVEYVDYESFPQEFSVGKDSELFGRFQDVSEVTEEEVKGRRGTLEINAVDKRPKCQPIGAQIDCRCGVSTSRPAGGWCALWKCEGIKSEANPVGHWACASWC